MGQLTLPMMLRVSSISSCLPPCLALSQGFLAVLNFELGFQRIVCSYGTDVPYLMGDHKRYLYGPGSILVAHGDDEHVLKNDLFEAVEGYKGLIRESLNPTRRTPAIAREVVAEEFVVSVEDPTPEVVIATAVEIKKEVKMESVNEKEVESQERQDTQKEEL